MRRIPNVPHAHSSSAVFPMHVNKFDLNLLIGLDALLTERNVSRAAKRVFVTQPAMSQVLRKLREYFQDPLLVSVGRTYVLSPKAVALVAPVQEALLSMRGILRTQPPSEAANFERAFAIMIPGFVVPWLIPDTVRCLTAEAPQVRLRLEIPRSGGIEQLARGEIDFLIALDVVPLATVESRKRSLRSCALGSVKWACAVSADHPTVDHDVSVEQLLTLPHVAVRLSGDPPLATSEIIRREWGSEIDVRVTTENVLELPYILPGTSLIAIVPETLALQMANQLSIRIVRAPPGLLPERRLNLLWDRHHDLDPQHRWLQKILLTAAASAATAPVWRPNPCRDRLAASQPHLGPA